MRKGKYKNAIIGIATMLTLLFSVSLIPATHGELITESMVELGMWDKTPIFPNEPSWTEDFEDAYNNLTFTDRTGYIYYAHNEQIIDYPDENNHILYIYNQSGYAGDYCFRYDFYGIKHRSIEFDYYVLQTNNFGNAIKLYYFFYGATYDGSDYIDNATGIKYKNMFNLFQLNNASLGVRLDNNTDTRIMYFNVSVGDKFHIALSSYWCLDEGLVKYAYIIAPNGTSYIIYIKDASVVSKPDYLDNSGVFVGFDLFNYPGSSSPDYYLKKGFDNFKFYNESYTIEEVAGYTSSTIKGLYEIMPLVIVVGIVPAIIEMVRRF